MLEWCNNVIAHDMKEDSEVIEFEGKLYTYGPKDLFDFLTQYSSSVVESGIEEVLLWLLFFTL